MFRVSWSRQLDRQKAAKGHEARADHRGSVEVLYRSEARDITAKRPTVGAVEAFCEAVRHTVEPGPSKSPLIYARALQFARLILAETGKAVPAVHTRHVLQNGRTRAYVEGRTTRPRSAARAGNALDEIMREVWTRYGAGQLTDDEAGELTTLAHERQAALRGSGQTALGLIFPPPPERCPTPVRRHSHIRGGDRRAAYGGRRRARTCRRS